MSNFRAVATVTATLQHVLQSAIQADVPGATVTTVRPGDDASANLPTTGINLFLYQVTQNPHRINDDLPTRRSDGATVQRPVAPVELHYLMSCYGDDLKLEPQRVLGSALAFLHSQPQLTRAQVQAAVGDPAKPFLAASDLADQIDVVRFTPTSLTLDELSRLWSVFLQTHYVLSTTFKAATLLLERPIAPRPAPPTRSVGLAAVPFRAPRITAIAPVTGMAIIAGSVIAIDGSDLVADGALVEIDGANAAVTTAEDARITLSLPADLPAGPHTLAVRQLVNLGAQTGARPAFAAGAAAFVVQPAITRTAGNYDISINNVQGTGTAPRSATVAVHLVAPVGSRQIAMLELLTAQQLAYRFPAAPLTDPTQQLTFAITGVTAGDYFLQVRIDGAASPLDLDAAGNPVGPKETVP